MIGDILLIKKKKDGLREFGKCGKILELHKCCGLLRTMVIFFNEKVT